MNSAPVSPVPPRRPIGRVLRFVLIAIALSSVVLARQATPPQGAGGRGAATAADGSSIVGTVTTDGKQPIAGLTVRVMSRIVVPGDPAVRYMERSTARTNARGEFQFSLLAGDYIVDIPLTQTTVPASVRLASARGTPAGAAASDRIADSLGPPPYFAGAQLGALTFQTMGPQGVAPAPRAPTANEVLVYGATIFPNARTTRDARVITLRPAETFRADIQVPIIRGRRVSGMLTGSQTDVGFIALRLIPVMDDLELFRDVDFEEALTVSDERGAFTFLGVPPGRYTLKALYVPSVLPGSASAGGRGEVARVGVRGGGAPTEAAMAFVRWAETIVNVRDADLDGLDVPLKPAIRVTGTIRAEAAAAATPDFSQARIGFYSNRPVTIAPPATIAVAADGSFAARIYGPGLYQAQVSSVPGFVVRGLSPDGVAPPAQWLRVAHDDFAGVAVTLLAQPLGRGGAPLGVRLGAPPSAPPPPPHADNAFLAGRVIDGATNAPIPNATVMLQRSGTSIADRRVALTDDSGAFTFGDALAGSYAVTTTAPGYSPGAFGRLRADGTTSSLGLAVRERVAAMIIRMWKPGAISGRVTDAKGQAIAGLSMVSLRVTELGVRRDYLLQSFARTDGSGTYRFGSLAPGDYLVCASFTPTTIPDAVFQAFRQEQVTSGRGGAATAALFAESRAPAPVPSSVLIGTNRFLMGSPESIAAPMPTTIAPLGDIVTYRSQCFPNATSFAESTRVHVDPGDDHNSINLTLPSLATVRVSGTLRGPAGPLANLGVRLVRASGRNEHVIGSERLEAAAAISDASGAFSFLGVSPGNYLLRAWTTHVDGQTPPPAPVIGNRPPARSSGVTLWAEVPVTVGESNLSNLAVTLAPTARVNGRLVFEGSAPAPGAFPLALSSRQPFDPPLPLPTTVNADGTFTLLGYAPGRYGLPVNTVGPWRVTSATLDGKTLSGHAIDVATRDISNLVLTATDRFTTLFGQVASVPDLGPIGATVCIFPADYRSWFADDMTPTRVRSFRVSGAWTYTATWLPPGDYLAIVYREAEGAEMTPAFIERLAKLATPVTLRQGEKTTLDLRVVSIR